MTEIQRRHILALAGGTLAASTLAAAQPRGPSPWPERPLTLVVPFPAGGQTDVVARLIAERLGRELSQPVVVDNRPGVNGSLGSEQVARARPDGYTLVATGPGSHAINQLVNPNVRYDARTDFSHLALVARTANVLLASPAFPVASVADLVVQARARPGTLLFAITGIGSSGHMSMELLQQQAGIRVNAVPYKGDAPALQDLLGGQVQLLFVNGATAVPQVRGGRLRALAVTGPQRLAQLPDVPTMVESGLPGVVAESWVGLSAPPGLAPALVRRLNAGVNAALARPEVRARLEELGMRPAPASPAQATAFVQAEVAKWAAVVQAGNIRVE